MIKHIVLWELEDKTQADANAAKMKERLQPVSYTHLTLPTN